MPSDYSKKTNSELIEILKSRSLPHTGKKADLVARLQNDDAKAKPIPPVSTRVDTADDVIDWDDDAPVAEEPVKPSTKPSTKLSTKPSDTTPPLAGKTSVPNPVAIPKQKPEPDPATADDSKVEPKSAAPPAAAVPDTKASAPATTEEKVTESAEPPAAAASYSIGLPSTELEDELKKRKARAEKFGIAENSATALGDAEKAVQRAKRFGASSGNSNVGVKGLDEALPEERPRKRRRDGEEGGRGGKRRNFGGRNRRTISTRGRNDRAPTGNRKSSFNEKDALANEARKKRFAAAA